MLTSFGRFNLIFNKIALIFLRVAYLSFSPFQVSSFNMSDCLDFIAETCSAWFTQCLSRFPHLHVLLEGKVGGG